MQFYDWSCYVSCLWTSFFLCSIEYKSAQTRKDEDSVDTQRKKTWRLKRNVLLCSKSHVTFDQDWSPQQWTEWINSAAHWYFVCRLTEPETSLMFNSRPFVPFYRSSTSLSSASLEWGHGTDCHSDSSQRHASCQLLLLLRSSQTQPQFHHRTTHLPLPVNCLNATCTFGASDWSDGGCVCIPGSVSDKSWVC